VKCEKASEITAYLKGESAPEERETLRLHFEGCASCSAEIEKFDKVLKALGRLENVEPSPGFRWRVREAFVRAHPEFIEPPPRERTGVFDSLKQVFGYVPAWAVSVAAHVILLAVAAILFFSPPTEEEVERDLAVRATPKLKPSSAPAFDVGPSNFLPPVTPKPPPADAKKDAGIRAREKVTSLVQQLTTNPAELQVLATATDPAQKATQIVEYVAQFLGDRDLGALAAFAHDDLTEAMVVSPEARQQLRVMSPQAMKMGAFAPILTQLVLDELARQPQVSAKNDEEQEAEQQQVDPRRLAPVLHRVNMRLRNPT